MADHVAESAMRKLDRYDLAILQTLQSRGRITKLALAEAINLSPSPCWDRLRKLEEAGYISIKKEFKNNKSLTTIKLNPLGIRALKTYLKDVESLLKKLK